MAKSSQDVRTHILALRDELIDNLEFIRTAIRADRQLMEAYFKEHGDLKYRPITGRNTDGTPNGWGTPTEINVEPLAASMRTTVKSLIDSIRVIEGEILPEDNPEGASTLGTGSEDKRAALRAEFRAQAGSTETHSQALPEPTESQEPIVRTPKEDRALPAVKAEKPGPKDASAPKPNTVRPWRETTPRAFPTHKPAPVSSPNVEEPKPTPKPPISNAPINHASNNGAPIGLSPKLRASLGGSVAESRMDAMRAKYAKKSDDSE